MDQGQDDAGHYYNVAQVVPRMLAGRPPTSPKPKRATIAGKKACCAIITLKIEGASLPDHYFPFS